MTDSQINLIRAISAFAVVCLHVSAKFVIAHESIPIPDWWLANVVDAFVRWCVPSFIMLTGALSLNKPVPELRNFYIRKFRRIGPPLLLWSAFYSIYYFHQNEGATLFKLTKNIAKGTPYYHLWYLYMLPGLYLISPFAAQLISHCSKYELLSLVVVSLGIAGLDHLLNQHNTIFITSFIPYIGYFLAGAYFVKYPPTISTHYLFFVFLTSGALIALLTGLLLPYIGNRAIEYMYGYLNPLVIVLSLTAFGLTLAIPMKIDSIINLARWLSPTAFGIYLIHPFILELLHGHMPFTGQHPLLVIPLATLLVFTFSSAITALILKHQLFRKIVA